MRRRMISLFLAFVLFFSCADINALAMPINVPDTEGGADASIDEATDGFKDEASSDDSGTEANKDAPDGKAISEDLDTDTEETVDESNDKITSENSDTSTEEVSDAAKTETADGNEISENPIKEDDVSSEAPSASMDQSFLTDLESPYDGDYLLVANVSSIVKGEAESSGTLSEADSASYNVENSDGHIFLIDNPDIYDFDENGRGLIDPNSFLPEPIVDEGSISYKVSREAEAVEYYIGYERSFRLNTTSNSQYNSVDCVCVAVSEYCTVWVPVEDPIYVADAEKMKGYMSELAEEYDSQFPKMTEMFGSKDTVDRLYGDNDQKTALLCYDINGNGMSGSSYTAGYFFSGDLNINYSNRTNNNIDCLHIDSWQGMRRDLSANTLNSTYGKRTMVHELQHMINFSVCRDNDNQSRTIKVPTYLNEAYSEAAAHLCYGEATNRITNYNNNSNIAQGKVSLIDWGGYNNETLGNYALSYLFGQYIRTQYENGDTVYKDTMNDLTESNTLFEVIADKLDVTQEELLLNFRAALFLKNAEGVYGFAGEKWAESINPKYNSAVSGAGLSLVPGAASVIRISDSFEPSGAGSNIRFMGMYKELTRDDIEVLISGGNIITDDMGQLQLFASVLPKGVDQSVIFSMPNEAEREFAEVSTSGLVSAISNGIVTVRASSVYNPSKYADITITITERQSVVIEQEQSPVFGGIRVNCTVTKPSGALVYYTIGGEVPTQDSPRMPEEGLVFDTEGSHTLRLLGHDPDGVYKDSYSENIIDVVQLPEPEISTEAVEIDDAVVQRVAIQVQDGAKIYYTLDSSEPSMEDGMEYSGSFIIDTPGTTTVKAIAVKEGAVASRAASQDVNVYSAIVMEKSRTLVPGGIRVVYTVTEPSGILLYYTTDGETPTVDSAIMPEDGLLFDVVGTYTLKVLGHDPDGLYRDSQDEDVIVVEQLPEPVISTETEIIGLGVQSVTIQAQDGADIYYTTDFSRPSVENGEKYEGSFIIDTRGTTTVKAIALKDGMAVSPVASKAVLVQYAYEYMTESERKPYLTQMSFLLNKKSLEGAHFSILPIMENTILDAELLDDTHSFSLERIEGTNEWELSLINKELANKSYQSQVLVISKSTDNIGYVDVIDIKLKVTDTAPKVSLKAVKINTVYPDAGYPLDVSSKSGSVGILGISNGNNAGFTDNFEIRGGKLYLKKPYDEFVRTPANKPILSGKLMVQVEGYEPQELALNIKTTNKAPTLTASLTAIKLNHDRLSLDKSFKFTLDKTFSSKERFCLDDIKDISLDADGGSAYDKAAALVQDISCSDGKNITVSLKDIKAGIYTLPLLVSAGQGEDSFRNVRCNVRFIIDKENIAPVLKLSTNKLRLNRQVIGEKAYIEVKSVTQSNMELTGINCECDEMTNTVNMDRNVSLSYNANVQMLEAKITEEPACSTYKFICTPAYNGVPSQDMAMTVTVNIIDKTPSISIKAKGSIDVLNRNTTAVTYNIKGSGFADERISIKSVKFEEASKLTQSILDARKFFNEPALNRNDSVFRISAKADAVFTKGMKYAFRLKFVLEGSGKEIATKDIIIKPRQSSVRLSTSAKPVFYTYVNTGNNTRAVTLQSNNAAIERVEWNADANKKIPEGITPVIESGQLKGVAFNGNGSIKKGKYKLTFNVYYEGQMLEKPTANKAAYAKPTVYRLTVTVK